MRTQIKDSWLKVYINKPKELYREYKTYYNKIRNINKIFYFHKIANVPMHIDTQTMLMAKVDNYLKQMNIIYFAAKNCEVVSANNPKYKQHALSSYIPLGSGENSVYISRMASKKEFFKICKEKREPVIVKSPTILEKIKKMLKDK
jgi:hypothetical protein